MASVRIVILGQPCAKGRPQTAVRGRFATIYTPKKTRTREGIVASLATDAMKGRPPFAGSVVMSMLAILEIPASWSKKRRAAALAGTELPTKKPDASNILKLYEDAMNSIVYMDDSQIIEIRIRKIYGPLAQTIIDVTEI